METDSTALVQAHQGSGFLVSNKSYADFQVRAQFSVDADANSGVFLRCSDPQHVTSANAYEVNIYDKNLEYGTGAIVDLVKPSANIKAAGRWNTYEITAKGPHFTIILNGAKTAELDVTKHPQGPIALQYSAGLVKFRSVQIQPLINTPLESNECHSVVARIASVPLALLPAAFAETDPYARCFADPPKFNPLPVPVPRLCVFRR